jgi:hypothetical protein
MIAALLLASAPVATAIDADIAFARDAKRMGQWTAFRKWADRDAVMFTPQAVWAKTFLKPLKDPPRSITWRPAQSYLSCDGRTAVNMGPWFTQDHRLAGFFTTVWQRGSAGWRWVYDGGIPTVTGSKGATPRSVKASCSAPPGAPPIQPPPALEPKQALTTPQDNGRGESADGTLGWDWKVTAKGERTFRVFLWNGKRFAEVIHAVDPARKAK